MAKRTTVELEEVKSGLKHVLDFQHALNLLSNSKSFKLPKDSKWIHEKGDLTRRKPTKGPATEQTAQDGHRQGEASK